MLIDAELVRFPVFHPEEVLASFISNSLLSLVLDLVLVKGVETLLKRQGYEDARDNGADLNEELLPRLRGMRFVDFHGPSDLG